MSNRSRRKANTRRREEAARKQRILSPSEQAARAEANADWKARRYPAAPAVTVQSYHAAVGSFRSPHY